MIDLDVTLKLSRPNIMFWLCIFVKGLNNIEKRMSELAGPDLKFNVLSPEYESGHHNIWCTNAHIPLNVLHHRHQQQGISIPSLICVQGCRSRHLFLGRQVFILSIGVYSYMYMGNAWLILCLLASLHHSNFIWIVDFRFPTYSYLATK